MKKKIILIIVLILIVIITTTLFILSKPFIQQNTKKQGFKLEKKELSTKLQNEIEKYAQEKSIDAIIINDNQNTYYKYGNINKSTNLASVRKSIISLLYGIAIEKGLVDINKTLAELGINESKNSLSEGEKQATIKDLLMAKSGVYIESGGESQGMKDKRPARYQYKPGEHYYYNNWDFNVLGYIFEQETKMKIGEALNEWIGKKIGFQDFKSNHVIYALESKDSDFETWRIYMSARDLAKIGTLILNNGNWGNKTIISPNWIEVSTNSYSKTPYKNIEYGYLWWIDAKRDVFYAEGSGGQFLIVDKKNNLTICLRKDTGVSVLGMLIYRYFNKSVKTEDAFKLYDKLEFIP